MINKNERFYVIIFLVLCLFALIFFGWIDLEFNESVFAPSTWTKWVERAAYLPTMVVAWLESLILTAYCFRKQQKEDAPVLVLVLGLLSSVGLPIYAYWDIMQYFHKDVTSVSWLTIVAILIVAIWATARVMNSLSAKEEGRKVERATVGLLIFYAIWGVSYLLSYVWGRCSFLQIIDAESQAVYTPWFQPGSAQGTNATAISTVALSFSLFVANYLQDGNHRGQRNGLMLLGLVYGIFIGWVCMRNGSVYGSDIVVAALFAYAILVGIAALFHKFRPMEAGALLYVRHDGV
jgi:hypothetical protein